MNLRDAIMMNFRNNHWVLTRHAAGITHEESLARPGSGGNTLNWVLGHIVASRNDIFELLGEPRCGQADAAPTCAAPMSSARRPHGLSAILADLERSGRHGPPRAGDRRARRDARRIDDGKQLAFFSSTRPTRRADRLLRRLAGRGVIS
jgi:hypothetical protein